jgi:hypothetical protein
MTPLLPVALRYLLSFVTVAIAGSITPMLGSISRLLWWTARRIRIARSRQGHRGRLLGPPLMVSVFGTQCARQSAGAAWRRL